MNFKKISLTLTVMALAMGAFAQRGGGFGQRMGGGMASPATLLMRDDVKDELKITAEETTKLQELQEKSMTKMREVFQGMRPSGGGAPDEDARKKMQEAMAKMQAESAKEIEGILTPEQNKRLKELVFQRGGVGLAANPMYQAELGITDDQKAKIATLQTQMQEAQRNMSQDMSREERQAANEKNRKIMNDEIAKILTDAQKKKLEDGKGKPFTFKDTPQG